MHKGPPLPADINGLFLTDRIDLCSQSIFQSTSQHKNPSFIMKVTNIALAGTTLGLANATPVVKRGISDGVSLPKTQLIKS
jgi:hypothetical protein